MEIRALLSAMWRSRVGPVLVAAQVAITLAVVVNVAYIVKLRVDNISQPIGADVDNLIWISMQAYDPEYNAGVAVGTDLTWLQSLPGVVAAANSSLVPQGFGTTILPVSYDASLLQKESGRGKGLAPAVIYMGTEKLVQTLGVKLIAGRAFDPAAVQPPTAESRETLSQWGPEVVITKVLADKLW